MLKPDDTKRLTAVFAYDTEEQRQEILEKLGQLLFRTEMPSVIGLSSDDEMKRTYLIEEAQIRYSDPVDRREAIDNVLQSLNLSAFTWNDGTTT